MAFSSFARDLGEGLAIHSLPFLLLFFCFEAEIVCTHQFHFLGQDQSTVA